MLIHNKGQYLLIIETSNKKIHFMTTSVRDRPMTAALCKYQVFGVWSHFCCSKILNWLKFFSCFINVFVCSEMLLSQDTIFHLMAVIEGFTREIQTSEMFIQTNMKEMVVWKVYQKIIVGFEWIENCIGNTVLSQSSMDWWLKLIPNNTDIAQST